MFLCRRYQSYKLFLDEDRSEAILSGCILALVVHAESGVCFEVFEIFKYYVSDDKFVMVKYKDF